MIKAVYQVDFAPRVEKQLEKIPKNIRNLIVEKIENLATNPRPSNVEPLHGKDDGLFRIRQGDYRIVYSIQDYQLLVLIVRVAHRKEVYTKKHSYH